MRGTRFQRPELQTMTTPIRYYADKSYNEWTLNGLMDVYTTTHRDQATALGNLKTDMQAIVKSTSYSKKSRNIPIALVNQFKVRELCIVRCLFGTR